MEEITREALMAAKVAALEADRKVAATPEHAAYVAAKRALDDLPLKLGADIAAEELEMADIEFDARWCECGAPLKENEAFYDSENGVYMCGQFDDPTAPCFAEAAKAAGLA